MSTGCGEGPGGLQAQRWSPLPHPCLGDPDPSIPAGGPGQGWWKAGPLPGGGRGLSATPSGPPFCCPRLSPMCLDEGSELRKLNLSSRQPINKAQMEKWPRRKVWDWNRPWLHTGRIAPSDRHPPGLVPPAPPPQDPHHTLCLPCLLAALTLGGWEGLSPAQAPGGFTTAQGNREGGLCAELCSRVCGAQAPAILGLCAPDNVGVPTFQLGRGGRRRGEPCSATGDHPYLGLSSGSSWAGRVAQWRFPGW